MALLLTVATCDCVRVARLITLLAHMALFATVATSIASPSWAVLGKVAHCE